MFRILCSFLNHKDPTRRIAIALVNRLRDHKGIRTYVTDFEGLGEILAALDGLSELQEDTLRREFSAQVFGNPTTIDRIDARLCRLLRDFGDDDATSDDELLRRYHLVRSPSHAFIKGPIVLVVDGQTFDLGRFGHEFALNKAIVDRLAIVSLEATIIVVHDSLESFESVVGPHHLSIHLGGMHGATQRSLLRKLLETAPRLHFLYTGDIDPQGIQRFERVQAETGVKFEPFHMDITTLERNRQGWKALTPGQRTRLMELRSSDRWAATVKFMLTNDCTLEQGMIAFEPPALTRGTTL